MTSLPLHSSSLAGALARGSCDPRVFFLSHGTFSRIAQNFCRLVDSKGGLVMILLSPGQGTPQKLHGPLLMRSRRRDSSVSLAGWNAAVRAFLRSGGRRSHVRSGPEWVATQKHRHWDTRPVQAVRPVSEGPQMPSRQVVKTNGVCGMNRYLQGSLGRDAEAGRIVLAITLGEPIA